ncbi:MAG TPA: hypothetical protein PK200_12855 [Spirochaetota bacterium]|nr:hypothetical protein [Spirochaetota bacterium]HQP47872.1 hypothetical protein [Spirochaetota bacterium]
MIREIIKPTKRDYTIQIPDEYLNRTVEILILPISDDQIKNSPAVDDDLTRKTAGILKDASLDPVQWQRSIRDEWDRK